MKFAHYTSEFYADVLSLFTNTFADAAGNDEGKLIGQLVHELATTTDENDRYGYVAREDAIIASVFLSRLKFENNNNVFILAPVAVATSFQQQGIGQSLIRFAIGEMKQKGVETIFTYGDPAYYSRVGFQPVSEQTARPPYKLSQPEGWLAQSLTNETIATLSGKAICVNALQDERYW